MKIRKLIPSLSTIAILPLMVGCSTQPAIDTTVTVTISSNAITSVSALKMNQKYEATISLLDSTDIIDHVQIIVGEDKVLKPTQDYSIVIEPKYKNTAKITINKNVIDKNTLQIDVYNEDSDTTEYNNWVEKYQPQLLDESIFPDSPNHDYEQGNDLYCNVSPIEAIILWSYGPAFDYWGTKLHDGTAERDLEVEGDELVRIGLPSSSHPKILDFNIERYGLKMRKKDYHKLDDALSHTTAAVNGTIVWHGYEYNEVEMIDAINKHLELASPSTILDLDPAQIASGTYDASKLRGKSIKNLCWCATTIKEQFARDWANGSDKTNVPIYKMHLNKDVHCLYSSYSRKKWFKKPIYSAWPHEFQVLTERNLTFDINDAYWQKRPNRPGYFLILDCDVSLKN